MVSGSLHNNMLWRGNGAKSVATPACSEARRATGSLETHVGTAGMPALLTCAFAYGRGMIFKITVAMNVPKSEKVAAIPCGNEGIPIRCIQCGTAFEVVVPYAAPCYCT